MKSLTILLLLLLALLPTQSAAQVPDEPPMHFGIDLVAAFPRGDFDDHVSEMGAGLSTFFGGRVPGFPFVLGTELGWLTFASQDRALLLQTNTNLSSIHTNTSRNILSAHLVARLTPQSGLVRPYVDGILGIKYFISRARIEADTNTDAIVGDDGVIIVDGVDRSEISVTSSFNDLAFSAGVGVGIDFDVWRQFFPAWRRDAVISVSLGARYVFGPKMQFLPRESFPTDVGNIVIEAQRSRTDMIVPTLGLRVDI